MRLLLFMISLIVFGATGYAVGIYAPSIVGQGPGATWVHVAPWILGAIGAVLGGLFAIMGRFSETVVESLGVLAAWAVVAGGLVGLRQINELQASLDAQVYGKIYDGLNINDHLFIDHPELRPYFYEGRAWPTDPEMIQRLKAAAELRLELIDFWFSQSDHLILDSQDNDGWRSYFDHSFQNSVVFCEVLREQQRDWGDELLALASFNCSGIEPRKPLMKDLLPLYFPPRTTWGPQRASTR